MQSVGDWGLNAKPPAQPMCVDVDTVHIILKLVALQDTLIRQTSPHALKASNFNAMLSLRESVNDGIAMAFGSHKMSSQAFKDAKDQARRDVHDLLAGDKDEEAGAERKAFPAPKKPWTSQVSRANNSDFHSRNSVAADKGFHWDTTKFTSGSSGHAGQPEGNAVSGHGWDGVDGNMGLASNYFTSSNPGLNSLANMTPPQDLTSHSDNLELNYPVENMVSAGNSTNSHQACVSDYDDLERSIELSNDMVPNPEKPLEN